MSLFEIGILGVVICFFLIFLGMPIYMAFTAIGFLGLWVVRGLGPAFSTIGSNPYTTASMYVWTVVPLFVFMGYAALYSGITQEFYNGMRKWIGHVRGGLAMTVVGGMTAFGACTGDPVGAAVTFSSMSLTEMRKFSYDDKLTLGSVAAGSILAGLIPPSLSFIIYGALTETSIGELFMGGVIPGLILAGLYLVAIFVLCKRNPLLGPPTSRATWKERLLAGKGMWILIIVLGTILGGIFAGVFTPTEAGAAGAFVVFLLGLIRKRLNWQSFKDVIKETAITTGVVGMLLVGTLVFNTFLVVTKVPATIAMAIGGITDSPIITLWIIVVVIFILGMFIDALAILLIMTPILYPVAVRLGIDPIQFGVTLTTATLLGAITPPFGIVVYAVGRIAHDVPLFSIFRGAMPFIIAIMVLIALLIFFPGLSTFLPQLMKL